MHAFVAAHAMVCCAKQVVVWNALRCSTWKRTIDTSIEGFELGHLRGADGRLGGRELLGEVTACG